MMRTSLTYAMIAGGLFAANVAMAQSVTCTLTFVCDDTAACSPSTARTPMALQFNPDEIDVTLAETHMILPARAPTGDETLRFDAGDGRFLLLNLFPQQTLAYLNIPDSEQTTTYLARCPIMRIAQ